ncbi:unnamed protein product [Sympodiomycopsis kandeliae]
MTDPSARPSIPPSLALDLRLRALESTIGSHFPLSDTTKPIYNRTISAQELLSSSTADHSALKRFIQEYDSNRRILDGAFQPDPDQTHQLSVDDQIVLILEAESEMRRMERVLSECHALDQRGVSGSGNLSQYQQLQPSLDRIKTTLHTELEPNHTQLQERLFKAIETYHTNIDTLSRLFIDWDAILTDMEHKIGKLEREQAKRDL